MIVAIPANYTEDDKCIQIIHLILKKTKALTQQMFQLYKTINIYNELRNVSGPNTATTPSVFNQTVHSWPIWVTSEIHYLSLLPAAISIQFCEQGKVREVKSAINYRPLLGDN